MHSYPAPAKLNLFLHVVGRRADGYHLLQSVFRFVDFGDSLEYAIRHDGAVLRTTDVAGIPPEQDLCVRAARLLQQHTGCQLGVDITLDKRLPMGGGLGGGSSDAATTLLVLNKLWELGLSRAELQMLGLQLGADVPVFIFGESAFAEGVGEKLQPVTLPPAWYVILVPPAHVPTAKIFASEELTRDTNPIKMSDFSAGYKHNDLETVVCKMYPAVANHLAWLKQRGDARMTGSGACVFASYETEELARAVLAEKPQEMVGFVSCGLDRHPLWSFAQ
ncbi:4-(cytidine 5'-diphospho)-2-C-methyl-D-erythritol kinase [Sulfurirhabdus autotrophica]|uniref:4-diphosphocytidyl-2-C-methyl-D-erythritol kinase n=1 Tax=Sulfurirhabdus autotrophica TaxID=1706046 RepID=A0A4R3XZZ0_9PROT|nr:4-(cytidine 5'-diphospho)-2-C-methyl-D-erythritol kinase [Sulfurirhabdus autotrophica]TCV84722.1 4-diphosphocytidyl-2-C-methyl-D-erythritol kinase [Sulfurirhabdus autotrophica]